MQREVFGKALRVGRDFALIFRDIPEQAEGTVWPKSINTHANLIPTARKLWKFLNASSLSESSANWEDWRNDSGMARVHKLRKALEENRVSSLG